MVLSILEVSDQTTEYDILEFLGYDFTARPATDPIYVIPISKRYNPSFQTPSGEFAIDAFIQQFGIDSLSEDFPLYKYVKDELGGRVFEGDGNVTSDSWEKAFSKIAGICRVERDSKENPDLKDLYYIRGIARNRCEYFNNYQALDWLKAARSWDVEMDRLREIACNCRNWTNFKNEIIDAIEYQKELQGYEEE